MDSVVTRSPLLDRYETEVFSLTSSHTTQCINSAAGVLYCCVLAIVHEGYDDSMTAGTTDKNEAELAPLSHIFSSDGEFVDLAQYGLDTFKALLQGATMKRSDCIREDIIVTEGGDFYGQQLARWSLSEEQLAGEVRSNAAIGAATFNINGTTPRKTKNAAEKGLPSMLHATIQGLQIFQQHAVVRRQVLRLLAGDESTVDNQPLPSKPLMSSTERGIQETELLSFTPLSPNDLYRNHRLQHFDEMLHSHSKDLPNFTGSLQAGHGEAGAILKRRFYRQLSAFGFAQVLAAEEQKDPVVIKQYYQLTDNLLMVLFWPPPDRRCRRQRWETMPPAPAQQQPSLNDSHSQQDSPGSRHSSVRESPAGSRSSTPANKRRGKGQQGRGASAAADGDGEQQRLHCVLDTVTLTPAGSAIAKVQRFGAGAEAGAAAWLTVHLDGDILGLRREVTFDSVDATAAAAGASVGEGGAASIADAAADEDLGFEGASLAGDHSLASAVKGEETSLQPKANGLFFWHTSDDVRFSAFAGPSSQPIRKPDGLGTCCLSAAFPDGMVVTLCSNGTIKFDSTAVPSLSLSSDINSAASAASVASAAGTAVAAAAGGDGLDVEPERTGGAAEAIVDASTVATTEIDDDCRADGERELCRFLSAGATVMRVLEPIPHYKQYVPVRREVLEADGTRTWLLDPERMSKAYRFMRRQVREEEQRREQERLLQQQFGIPEASAPAEIEVEAANGSSSDASATFEFYSLEELHRELLTAAPEGCTSIQMKSDGSVVYFFGKQQQQQQHSKLTPAVMMSVLVDGESKSTVASFRDGRVLIQHSDGRREACFPDGTVILSLPAEGLAAVSRHGLPPVEMDVEVDAVSREHAKGKEVPINKSGERVRARVALPDGSAALIKYDTKLTALTNGSLKVVRRDKTSLLVNDAGTATFRPSSLWDAEAERQFASERIDVPGAAQAPPAAAAPVESKHQQHHHHHAKFAESTGQLNGGTAATLQQQQQQQQQQQTVAAGRRASRAAGSSSPAKTGDAAVALAAMASAAASPMGLTPSRRSRDRIANVASTAGAGVDRQSPSPERPDTGVLMQKDEEARFTVDFLHLSCIIMDREYNRFRIDLSGETDALAPVVELSGEVQGLKPPAVTDKPMEPRLFVVSRSAEATEVLGGSAVAHFDALARSCPEMSKAVAGVELPPSDLGPAKLNSYFQQRRLLGQYRDGFDFQSVFGPRRWYTEQTHGYVLNTTLAVADSSVAAATRTPAAAHLMLRRSPYLRELSEVAAGRLQPTPRFFECWAFVEQPPLSNAGHEQLKCAIKQCNDFREARLKSIDRFAVDEDRSEEELQQVEALAKRLKLAYKAAKANAAKKKEAREKARQAAAHADAATAAAAAAGGDADAAAAAAAGMGSPGGMGSPDLLQPGSTILEGTNEDEDGEDGEGGGDDFLDDEEPELDPLDQLLRECFDDFSIHQRTGGWSGANDYEIVLPRTSLQECLIQLFNCYIPEESIDFWLEQSEEAEVGLEDLTFHEFRSLYKCMEEGDAVGKLRHREDVSGKMPFSISHKSSSFREVGAQPVGGYWESGDGRRTMSSLPSTAPPLDLRQLEWHAHSGSGDASPTNECAATVGGVYPYREHRQREADAESLQQQHQHEQRQGDPDDFAPAEFVSPFASPLTGDPVSVGGVNGKSSFPAGSALQAARSAK